LERGGSQLCVFYDHELTPPLMALKPAEHEVNYAKPTPILSGFFFACRLGLSGVFRREIVQKMLHEWDLKNFTELYRQAPGQSNQLSQLIDLTC
jgi:hypothetical protein